MHIKVSSFDGGGVEKHQEDAGHREDDEEKAGDPAEAEGIGESEAMALYLCRKDMEEKVVKDQHRSLQIGIWNSCSKDGTPNCRFRNALKDSFLHFPSPHIFNQKV